MREAATSLADERLGPRTIEDFIPDYLVREVHETVVDAPAEVALSAAVDANAPPPIPPGYRRPVAERRQAFTLAAFDRLRVLTTEVKRLIAAGAPVALRLGVGPALDESRLASALWWV